MSVEMVLDKIKAHNADVLGCIAKRGDDIWGNLPEIYELVDTGEVTEHAENVFALTEGLESEHAPFDQMFLEFENHSIFARKVEDGLLFLLSKPMERSQFKKMQLGVNLFLKPLSRAMDQTQQAEPEPEPAPASAIRKTNRKRWF